MDFLFHSVYNLADHAKYFNVYKLEENRFLAECHHFNRERDCLGDFELVKEGDHWTPNDHRFDELARQIGEEIERMEPIQSQGPRSKNHPSAEGPAKVEEPRKFK